MYFWKVILKICKKKILNLLYIGQIKDCIAFKITIT